MKLQKISLTIGTTCLCLTAHAQSSVTLYGVVDEGLMYVSNESGHRNIKIVSGTTQNDRWGFKVNEDLGSGLSAIAQLENGFDITSGKLGQGGREFGRQSWVGLSDVRFGTLTAGRQYDAIWDMLGIFSAPVNENSLASNIGDNDNLFGSFRYSNSVKYVTPSISGLQAEVLYAFSNESGGFSVNRALSSGISYAHGPLSVAIAYLDISKPGLTNPSGAVSDDYAGAPFQLFHTSPLKSTVGVETQREYGAGGAYTFGKLRISGIADDVHYTYLDSTSLNLANYELGASYFLTPALALAGGFTYTSGRYGGGFSGNPKWYAAHASLDYYLSKRTDVNVWVDAQQSSHGPADVFLSAPSTSNRQTVIAFSLRHKF